MSGTIFGLVYYARILGIIFIAVVGSGCATSSELWTPPQVKEIENEQLINSTFDETWDRLVRNLSSDYFVINNIEKASRIINASFSTTDPDQYLDCGSTTRTFKYGQSSETVYYRSASSADYNIANQSLYPTKVHRRTDLDGRINIYVAPVENKTLVSVNSKYILSVSGTYEYFLNYQWHTGTIPVTTKSTLTSTASSNDGGWHCRSTGVLEKRILKAANPN